MSIIMSFCCFTCHFVKCVCSRKANFYIIIDNRFCILHSVLTISSRIANGDNMSCFIDLLPPKFTVTSQA